DVANEELFFRSANLLRVVTEHRTGQAELRVVRDTQRVLEVTGANHRQNGTEDLLLSDRGMRSNVADYSGLDEEPVLVAHSAAGQKFSFTNAFVDVLLDLFHGRLIHDRPDLGLSRLRRTEFQRVRFLDDERNEAVVDRVIDDQPRACGALLALEAERGSNDRRSGFIEILCLAVDDDGVLPAHLCDHALDPDLPFAML